MVRQCLTKHHHRYRDMSDASTRPQPSPTPTQAKIRPYRCFLPRPFCLLDIYPASQSPLRYLRLYGHNLGQHSRSLLVLIRMQLFRRRRLSTYPSQNNRSLLPSLLLFTFKLGLESSIPSFTQTKNKVTRRQGHERFREVRRNVARRKGRLDARPIHSKRHC